MQFDEILTHVVELLQRRGRASYRALKLRFELDAEFLAGIKDELIDASLHQNHVSYGRDASVRRLAGFRRAIDASLH